MAKRTRVEEQEPGAPGWMVTYGDLMSLLLTFFVLLLSFATLEERKVKEAISSLKGALGVLPQSKAQQAIPDPLPPSVVKPIRDEAVKERIKRLHREIHAQGLDRQVQVGEQEQGILNIRLSSSLLFRSGSAEILPSAYPVLEDVAELLREHMGRYDSDVRVEGHTDDVPISPALARTFPSNWELSVARSLSIMHFLTDRTALPVDHFGVAGYGPHRPLRSPIELEENRKYNRRVEIVAIPRQNVEYAPETTSSGSEGTRHQPIPRDDLPEPI